MNLSHLYYFQKLAALESYAQASRELHITQPSLSNAMRSLERELGVVLFERVGRTSRLTDQGAEFLGYVNDSLGALEAGIEAMEHTADTPPTGRSTWAASSRCRPTTCRAPCWPTAWHRPATSR